MMYEVLRCLQETVKECANFANLDGLIFRYYVSMEIVVHSLTMSSPPCTIRQKRHAEIPVHAN